MYFNQVEFGKRIRDLRKAQGKTKEEMAEELYISVEHLNRLENGKVGISIDLLMEMSEGFAVSTDYLLVGKVRNQCVNVDRLKMIVTELNAILSES